MFKKRLLKRLLNSGDVEAGLSPCWKGLERLIAFPQS